MNLIVLLAQVKRELAGVLIFESHAKTGTVCKYFDKITDEVHEFITALLSKY